MEQAFASFDLVTFAHKFFCAVVERSNKLSFLLKLDTFQPDLQ